ncbi:MAG: sugar phosphate isomerase/epimerase [Anaerolineae bacterium]|nr:sugar phosphate isomerase/epimerase [Anaerolineae bacterium]
MKIGFVSAILPDLSLQEVLAFAAQHQFQVVELMCWPLGKAERRYAGVTHINVENLGPSQAQQIKELLAQYNVSISGLGYYPNPLTPDLQERQRYIDHLRKVIDAAALLGVEVVNTFIGRDQNRPVEAQWDDFMQVWPPLIQHAEEKGVKIAIENCPMLFSLDEWPGGKNLASSPAIWRKMFQLIPSPNFGLNYDPSHMIIQHMDEIKPIYEFRERIFHIHAKDQRIDRQKRDEVGIWGLGWYIPKLPGLGEVRWSAFFAALTEIRYQGPVCIEVEDRAYEDSLESRQRALIQSKRYLDQFQEWA